MKKDRNSFFSEYGFNSMNAGMNPNMMMPQGGANPGGNPNFYPGGGMPMPTDIDSRISKLERQLNRLETRVSKLEGDGGQSFHNEEYNFNNSMYMV